MSGTMNWNFGNEISMYSNIYGLIFYFLTNEMLERFGDAGEACARAATTDYGRFRGRLLWKDHEKKGLPRNLKTFQANYDLPTDERSKKSGKQEVGPGETRSQTYTCQFSDLWKLLAGQSMDADSLVGRIYCEQFHPAMWEGYDSRLVVELEEFLARGDGVCRFHTITLGEERDIPCYMPEGVEGYDWKYEDKVEVMGNICAFEYYFLVSACIKEFGDEGEEAMRAAVRKYGSYRGGLMAQYHDILGLEKTIENFFEHFDIEREKPRYSGCLKGGGENRSCRFSEICKVLEQVPPNQPGKIASIFCGEFYPAMMEGYLPGAVMKAETALSCGDDACHFLVSGGA